jgi:hypothetical protein
MIQGLGVNGYNQVICRQVVFRRNSEQDIPNRTSSERSYVHEAGSKNKPEKGAPQAKSLQTVYWPGCGSIEAL